LTSIGFVFTQVETGTVVDQSPFSSERTWSYTNPDVMIGILYPDTLASHNFKTKQTTVFHKFEGNAGLGDGEGGISYDDRWVVVSVGSKLYSCMIVLRLPKNVFVLSRLSRS
jgi:hypothetical protein